MTLKVEDFVPLKNKKDLASKILKNRQPFWLNLPENIHYLDLGEMKRM